jgi:class 3 adenylate cyclase
MVQMRDLVAALAPSWRRRGHQLDVGIGIGIALGPAMLGPIGFDQRRDYGAIGTVTNLASRSAPRRWPDRCW